ncbi:MAG: AsmA family protein [Alphaproteobacteria bacterium]|nr:AsmA family protein [Alphaproteobacteria bacterium]
MAIRIPWRQIAWITGISLPLVAVGAVLYGSTRDLSRYQARMVDQIRKVTGRDIATRVPLTLHLAREPALIAEGVTLTNASWGTRPALATVAKLTMYLEIPSLLLGEVKVGRILLEGADILVERNEAGDTNLDMLPPPDGSGPKPQDNRSLRVTANPAFPWIGAIEVRDSTLTLSDGPNRQALVLNVPAATFKSTASNQTLQMQARFGAPQVGQSAGQFNLTGNIGSFEGWVRGVPGNIDVQGEFGDGRIAIKGSVVTKGTNLTMSGAGADIAAFGPYLQLSLPNGGPYDFTAKATTQRNGFKVEVPQLKVGKSELTGEALFRVDRAGTPTVTVNVDAAKLDFATLHAPPARPRDPSAPVGRFFPTAPFSASWFGRSTLSLTARVGEVMGLSDKLTNGSLSLTSGEKRFTFRAAGAFGNGGSAGFDVVYDPAGRYGLTTFTATASRVVFNDVASLLGLDLGLKDAVGDIDLKMRGPGRSAREALNAASGTIEVSATKGTWPREPIAGWPAETQRLLGGSDAGVPFNCFAGSFEVRSGVANLRRLVVDTPRAVLVGGGYMSFRSEGFEFILDPEARAAADAALAAPLRVKGGTGKPVSGALEPALGKLLVGGGAVPSLAGTLGQIARQPNVANACATMAPRVDGMRPGLRPQMPTPVSDRTATRRPAQPQRNP